MAHRSPPLERSAALAREGARARHEEVVAAMSLPYAVQLVGQPAALDDHTARMALRADGADHSSAISAAREKSMLRLLDGL